MSTESTVEIVFLACSWHYYFFFAMNKTCARFNKLNFPHPGYCSDLGVCSSTIIIPCNVFCQLRTHKYVCIELCVKYLYMIKNLLQRRTSHEKEKKTTINEPKNDHIDFENSFHEQKRGLSIAINHNIIAKRSR